MIEPVQIDQQAGGFYLRVRQSNYSTAYFAWGKRVPCEAESPAVEPFDHDVWFHVAPDPYVALARLKAELGISDA